MRFCTNCGCQLKDDVKFCTSCGASCEAPAPKPAAGPRPAAAPSSETKVFPAFTPEAKAEPAPASKNPFFAPVDPNWNTDAENTAPTVAFDPPRSTVDPVPPVKSSGASNPVPPAAGGAPSFGASNPVPPAAGGVPFGGANPVPPTNYNPYGTPIGYGAPYGSVPAYHKPSYSPGHFVLIFLSLIIIFSALFVPPICEFGELIPDFSSEPYITIYDDMFEFIAEEGLNALTNYVVYVAVFSIIPAVLLLIGAAARSKVMSAIASCLGFLPFVYVIIDTTLLDSETFYLYSMFGDYSLVSIGFWIPLVLFGICLICSLCLPRRNRR